MATPLSGTSLAHSTSIFPNFVNNTTQHQGIPYVFSDAAAFWSPNYGSLGQAPPFGPPFGSNAGFPESKTIPSHSFGELAVPSFVTSLANSNSASTVPGSSKSGSFGQTPAFGTSAAPPASALFALPYTAVFPEEKTSAFVSTTTSPSFGGCSTQPSGLLFSSSWFASPQPGVQPTAYSQGPSSFGYGQLHQSRQGFDTPQPWAQPSLGVFPTPASTPGFGVPPPSPFVPPVASSFPFGESRTPCFQDSETPLFGVAPSSVLGPSSSSCLGWRPPSSIGFATSSSSDFAGFSPTVGETNQQGGSRKAPYCVTWDRETGGQLKSVSAMKNSSDKSHEELRWEDYKNFTSKGNSSSTPRTESDGLKSCNCQCRLRSCNCKCRLSSCNCKCRLSSCNCKCHQLNATPIGSATGDTQSTNDAMNTFVNFSNQPFATFSVPAVVTFIHPATLAFPSQHSGPTVASYTLPFGSHTSPVTVQFGVPNITNSNGCIGLNGGNLPSGSVASPVVGLHGGQCTCFVSGSNGGNCLNGASSVTSPLFTSPIIGSVGGSSTGCLGFASNSIPLVAKMDANAQASVTNPVSGTSGSPSTRCISNVPSTSFSFPAPFSHSARGTAKLSSSSASHNPNSSEPLIGAFSGLKIACPSPSSCGTQTAKKGFSFGKTPSDELKVKEDEKVGHIPKGLEIIVEKLGFCPWSSQGKVTDANKLDSESGGGILPCEEADIDEDIISLAEFAVEQHNALHKDDPVVFRKVIVACLEAVGGGRYHIVLDAVAVDSANTSVTKMHYAVVLRKGTDRNNHLTVLEKWLPCSKA